jgi:Cu-Zn family superoxide dismutase
MKKSVIALGVLLLAWSYSSAGSAQTQARADIKNADGTSVGTAMLRETKDGVLITINVKGLPQGLHAVHIHSVGKCEGPAFTSAGAHFNPLNKKHGLKSPEGPHAGDLPDIYVNKAGPGRYEALTESITLSSGEASIFDADGSSIVIHASPDDNMTDPSGNSGDRIACGVLANATKKATK